MSAWTARRPILRGALSITSLWLVWTAGLAALLVAAAITLTQTASELERRNKADLTQIASNTRTQIESYLDERRKDARVLASRSEIVDLLASPAAARAGAPLRAVQTALFQTQQTYGYHAIRLIDDKLRAVAGEQARVLQELENTAIQLGISTGQAQLVDLHVRADCQPCMGFVQPVWAGNDRTRPVVGALYLELSAQRDLYRLLPVWPQEAVSPEAMLVRNDAGELTYLTPLQHLPKAPPLGVHQPVPGLSFVDASALQTQDVQTMEGEDYVGTAVIGAVTRIRGTPWYLVVQKDKAVIQEPLYALQWRLAFGSVLFLFLLAWATWLANRTRRAEEHEHALEREAAFAAAKNISADGYVLIDESGHILETNPALTQLTGYSAQELLGKHLTEVDIDKTPTVVAEEMSKLRDGKAAVFNSQWRHRDGHALDLQISATYLQNAGAGFVQAYIRDIGPERQRLEHERRLRQLYEFLSALNASIHRAHTRSEIFDAVAVQAVRHGGFLLAWVGIEDRQAGRIVPVAVQGTAADYVQRIVITTDPALPTSQGPTRRCMVEQSIQTIDDFETDPRTLPWHTVASPVGIQSSAAVPVLVADEAVAVVNFYAPQKHYFNTEMRALLTETASNISLALQALEFKLQKQAAESARRESEERFARVFEVSPLPMQIYSYGSHKLVAVNQAMERVFGYTAADIPDDQAWFTQVYPDPVQRAELVRMWTEEALPQARRQGPGAVVTSPEMSLRCKDGSDKVVRGSMSVVGDEIIIQWQDLTETVQAQARLRQDEERFRSLVEQSLLGMYVTQNERIVYVNPRFCEIVGWSHKDLIGQDSLQFIGRDDQDKSAVLHARAQARNVGVGELLSLPFRHRDGHYITIGLQPSMGLWDGQPALMVMAQDLTERKRAEEKIAAYIQQLEGTMQGTLQAVARMVDLRDPYTSGHEKRVGTIASDIARAMGWEPERCRNLELMGLVHDIGKIAIPAELLSKPTRLTPLEYEMIKTHVEKGYEILKDVAFPIPIADIIRQHHERLDGSGYPLGLKGDQILPEARILAVADVLESMASHRPYRPALGMDQALQELESHKGLWFDTTVVDTVVDMVRTRGYQLPP
ncbi:MAG: PAS domain S-box protein [Rhodoferax sp.]|nr:MAG: PAS domain S-box protein [Rhodoferax sp.]